MTEIHGEPGDAELESMDAKLLGPGWINLLDQAGLTYRERQVVGWALRMAPHLRSKRESGDERMRFALASLLDWWDGMPNDFREEIECYSSGTPEAIKLARAICDADGPPEK